METKEILIGMKFQKLVNKKYVECYVYDIYNVIQKSQRTGKTNIHTLYFAKSEKYGTGNPFEVSKTTILRGL